MKNKWSVRVILLLFIVTPMSVLLAQKSYFAKLQTQKVKSTPDLEWTVIGPGNSGYSEELYIHPTDSNVMFLDYDMGNSYGTWDKSNSWQSLNDSDGKGSELRPDWISFSTQDPNYGVLIQYKFIKKTINKGKTWKPVGGFPGQAKYSVIAVDPNDKKTWYVGGGQYWRVKAIHRSLENPHGTKSKNTAYGHIYKTTDEGRTWKKIMNKISEDLDVGKIIVDPRNSMNLYVLTNFGFYKSEDGGETWKEGKKGLPYNDVRDLTHYYNKETKEFNLYCVLQTHYKLKDKTVASEGGVYKSTDGGESWMNMTGNLNFDLTKTTHPSTRWTYFRAISYWFGKKDYPNIRKSHPELPSKILPVFNRIVVNPKNPEEVYISSNVKHDFSFGPSELLRTLDGGKTWVTALRVGKYWKEKQDKEYWESVNNPLGINAKFAHLNGVNDENGFFGVRLMKMNSDGEIIICYEQQHLISKNQGNSWEQIDDFETSKGSKHWVGRGDSNLPGFGINLDTNQKGQYLFYTEEHGIWKSTLDGDLVKPGATALVQIEGQSVNHDKDSKSITALTVDPNNSNVYYSLTNRQTNAGCFRKSIDGGKTWETVSQPIKMEKRNLLYLFSIVVDKYKPNNISFCVPSQTERGWHTSRWIKNSKKFAEFSDYGVYNSIDGGKTWALTNKGLPKVPNVTHMAYDKNYKNLYAALGTSLNDRKGGLYKSANNGMSWKKMGLPSGVTSVKFIEFDAKGAMYIATGDGKTEIGNGGVFRSLNKGKSWKKIFDMPNTNRVAISKLDHRTIGVVVAPNRKTKHLNPGIYISRNYGATWTKSNKGLGQPDKIEGFGFDPFDKNVFWSSSHGSGFAKGVLKDK